MNNEDLMLIDRHSSDDGDLKAAQAYVNARWRELLERNRDGVAEILGVEASDLDPGVVPFEISAADEGFAGTTLLIGAAGIFLTGLVHGAGKATGEILVKEFLAERLVALKKIWREKMAPALEDESQGTIGGALPPPAHAPKPTEDAP